MKKAENASVRIIPLGGLEQIGMNITAIEYDDSIVVVDCGLSFPEEDMLGIDLVIPDVTYLKENLNKVKGFVITHGHEDHIGAIPYVLKDVNVPIYATKLTMGLIESKLKEHNMLKSVKRKVVKYGQSVTLGDFRVEFIRTNHSIADAAALAIYSPAGIIVHTGDFKVDYTPVYGDPIDLQRLGELGKKGVLALMCDSTNALRPGFTMSERTVGATFEKIFNDNKNSRIIIATFASNVDRVQQIINSAVKYGRKVCVEGRSMVNIIEVAEDLDYLKIPDGTLIETDEMKNYTPEQIVLITTGSQGESMAALSRMAANLHRKVSIQPGDCVVFSSTPIPGNEKSVAKVINELGTDYAGYVPTADYAGSTLVIMTNQYGSDQKMNITCDNAELADILGIPQAATQDGIYVEGSDVKAEIATGDDGKRIGFADSAILSTKGTVITVTDVNNKEFSMDVPGNAAGTVFDDSNNDGQSAAGAGTARTISQEVTDVGTMSIHVGANQDQVIVIDIPAITTYSLGTEHMNVMTQYTASRAISTVDEAINKTNKIRSRIGAYENRFDHTTNNLEVSSENLTKSLSTMIDTDMSEEMTTYTSETVLTQAATSILAQANERPSQVLQLLQ